jgi:hypothetical protein
MRVKIGDTIFDSSDEPILVIFEEEELEKIQVMAHGDNKFCAYPDNMDEEEVVEFIRDT